MTEEQFDSLIDIIDDLRADAQDTDGSLTMIDDFVINQIRVLCGLPKE